MNLIYLGIKSFDQWRQIWADFTDCHQARAGPGMPGQRLPSLGLSAEGTTPSVAKRPVSLASRSWRTGSRIDEHLQLEDRVSRHTRRCAPSTDSVGATHIASHAAGLEQGQQNAT